MKLSFDKKMLYDWLGANEWLFRLINELDGNPLYDSFMLAVTRIGDRHNFPYYLIAIFCYAALDFLYRKIAHKGGARYSLHAWIGVMCVFSASHFCGGLIVKEMKESFAYPRPYVALDRSSINVLEDTRPDEGSRAFPSGHAAFITLLVGSLWPTLQGMGLVAGLALVFAVCWSRVAVGMHFPADVMAGALISFAVVLLVRFVIYTLLLKVLKWKC